MGLQGGRAIRVGKHHPESLAPCKGYLTPLLCDPLTVTPLLTLLTRKGYLTPLLTPLQRVPDPLTVC